MDLKCDVDTNAGDISSHKESSFHKGSGRNKVEIAINSIERQSDEGKSPDAFVETEHNLNDT